VEVLLSPPTEARRSKLARRLVDENEPQDVKKAKQYRNPQQRDRDRILYSSAFQRLAYITQVTAPDSGHTFHNRLIHSLKVAHVGRRNTERLRYQSAQKHLTGAAAKLVQSLNPDAVEAACLAHDLGHPPFGHIAEEVLDDVTRTVNDGFEGNAQSFRIVTRLAVRADDPPGLNLTRQTLDGLVKYPWERWREDPEGTRYRKWGRYDDDKAAFEWVRKYSKGDERSLEAEIMDWADDLTYAVHDVDDFFRAGLIPLDRLIMNDDVELERLVGLLERTHDANPHGFPKGYTPRELGDAAQQILRLYGPTEPYDHTLARRAEMRQLGSTLITRYLEAFSLENASRGKVRLRIDPIVHREVIALKMLTVVYVVRSPALAVVQHGQRRLVRDLYDWYLDASNKPEERRMLPPSCAERFEQNPTDAAKSRAVVDLIAGFTETTAIQLHRRLSSGWTTTTLDAMARIG
jgi:dGTPase